VLIGAMSKNLPFSEKMFLEAIASSVKEKFVEINIKAFYGGRNAVAAG
jgi:Pyruvate/2-oxoacid:ferredoxin oxidoreductase gamma subunit